MKILYNMIMNMIGGEAHEIQNSSEPAGIYHKYE